MRDYLPIFVTWLVGMTGNLKNFNTRDIVLVGIKLKEWYLATLIAVVGTGAAVVTGWNIWQSGHLQMTIPYVDMDRVKEPSGGATFGDRAIIATDEPSQGIYDLVWTDDRYDHPQKCSIEDLDGKPVEDPNDLEAAVAAPGTSDRLYLLTSHSNTKKGNSKPDRRMLLEVIIPPNREESCVLTLARPPVDLRPAMLRALAAHNEFRGLSAGKEECADKTRDCGYINENDAVEILQAEGLAIDPDTKTAYIGLRAPLIDRNKAIVLTTPAADLFSPTLEFGVRKVALVARGTESPYYGISSLDFDKSGKIVILGTSPSHSDFYEPIVCIWSIAAAKEVECERLPEFKDPVRARPEVLLFSPLDDVVVFLDGDHEAHGQVIYSRKQLGL